MDGVLIPSLLGNGRQRQGIEPFLVGDMHCRVDNIVQADPGLLPHQFAVCTVASTFSFKARFIASKPARVLVSNDFHNMGTRIPVNSSA